MALLSGDSTPVFECGNNRRVLAGVYSEESTKIGRSDMELHSRRVMYTYILELGIVWFFKIDQRVCDGSEGEFGSATIGNR